MKKFSKKKRKDENLLETSKNDERASRKDEIASSKDEKINHEKNDKIVKNEPEIKKDENTKTSNSASQNDGTKIDVKDNVMNDNSNQNTQTPATNRTGPTSSARVVPPPKPISNKKDNRKLDKALFIGE